MKRLTFAALALAMSACTGSLLETKLPVPTIYVLAAAPTSATNAAASTVDLAVSVPSASPGLDTDRIAILKESRQLDYYREAQWGAVLPRVAQTMVVDTMQNQQLFRSVTTEQARVTANYFLDLAVRDFQAEYKNESSPPSVRVTLIGSLIRIKDRKLIAVVPATASVQTTDNRLGAVVEAFESAAQQAALSLGKQTASAIAANPPN
jgi:cholesterol transport system auxiliary component